MVSTPLRVPRRLTWLYFAVFLILIGGGTQRAEAQPPSALSVEADQVVFDQATQTVEATGNVRLRYRAIRVTAAYALFDLREERLVARGNVVFVDAQGRELRGESLIYDARLDIVEIREAEAVISRVFVRAGHAVLRENRLLAESATLTTCDPARPLYRITARQLEVIPEDRIVARQATLWVGRFRVLTVPIYALSLRSPEETSTSIPRFGYSTVDGLWLDYGYAYTLGTLPAHLYLKYGTRSGVIPRHTLRYRTPAYTADLTIGRNQDTELRLFDQAELSVSFPRRRQVGTPFSLTGGVSIGSYRDYTTGVATSRARVDLGVSTERIEVGRGGLAARATYSYARYGTGAYQSYLNVRAELGYPLPARMRLLLNYQLGLLGGGTPFVFDAVAGSDLVHKVFALLALPEAHVGAATAEVLVGPGYSFFDRSPLWFAGLRINAPRALSVNATATYIAEPKVWDYTLDAAVRSGTTTVGVSAVYHTRTKLFEALDYYLSIEWCDCVVTTLRYRQVAQEIWFVIGLTAFPETLVQFQVPRR